MSRKLQGEKLVIASHNPGKVREIGVLLRPFGVETVTAADLGLPEPEETGKTFLENALIKARAAAEASQLPALADDSGLAVKMLGGEPGIHSARWAGPEKDFVEAMEMVNEKLGDKRNRDASFVCALALCWPTTEKEPAHSETFEGFVRGHITWPPRGDRGFGYDPVFVPDGFVLTFAEMVPEQKHRLSHRADALKKLVEACFGKNTKER